MDFYLSRLQPKSIKTDISIAQAQTQVLQKATDFKQDLFWKGENGLREILQTSCPKPQDHCFSALCSTTRQPGNLRGTKTS